MSLSCPEPVKSQLRPLRLLASVFTQFQVLPAILSPPSVMTQGRKMTEVGTEGRAQWAKGLLSKHEDLSSGP